MDFGRHLALCAVETNRKGCWVIHLEAGLLVGADTRTVNAHTAQHTHTHRSGNTSSGSVGGVCGEQQLPDGDRFHFY